MGPGTEATAAQGRERPAGPGSRAGRERRRHDARARHDRAAARPPDQLSFRILGSDGEPVRDFEIEHEKRMHLIVVRRDLTGFQHLHPELDADGTWRTPLRIPEAGSYRVFADFKHDGPAQTLGADLAVDGPVDWQATAGRGRRPPGPPDGYEVGSTAVRLAGRPRGGASLHGRRDGEPVAVEPYLGAGGHLVALREGDLAYLHVHPAGTAPRQRSGGVHDRVSDRGPLPPLPPVQARRQESTPPRSLAREVSESLDASGGQEGGHHG